MSGFECTDSNALGLFGIDVHILGYDCNDQAGVFAIVLLATLIIKLMQNKLWAAQAQRQRELLQMEKCDRIKGFWSSPLAWVLVLEFLSTVIGIVSVLVIMGANIYIFLVIILANLVGTGWTYKNMDKDHHSTSKDLLNLCSLIDTCEKKSKASMETQKLCKFQQAKQAMIEIKKQLNKIDLSKTDTAIANPQSGDQMLAFNF